MIANIADFRKSARRKLPAAVFAYVENGGYEEETLRRNRADLEAIKLLPRVLNDVSNRTLETTLAGDRASFPVALAPVGALGITHANGEVCAAKAALAEGVPFCLSTLSIGTIEDVAEATKAPFWFQLYQMREKSVGEALVQRAKDAGCSALVLSMDLHVRSRRYEESRHGIGAPPRMTFGNVIDGLLHPGWLGPMAFSKRRTFGNLVGLVKDAESVPKLTLWLEEQFDPTLGVKDIEWARKAWPRKLIVKGILHPEEARLAIDSGADAIVVSNHGGRQVDGAVSTVSMLARIVDAVGGRGQVLVDSGIRSGTDILKMLALGADGCLIGRAYVYALAAEGEKGVAKALDILRGELDENLALCGLRDIHRLPKDLVDNQPFGADATNQRAFLR